MRGKHLQLPADSALLKNLQRAVREQLRPDRRKTALLLTRKFCCYAALLLVTYAGIWTGSGAVTVLAYVAYGITAVLMGFNFAHDLSHNAVFRSKGLNNAGFTFLYALLGAHAEGWKQRHVQSHHYAPNVRGYDTDLAITGIIRVEPGSALRWYHRFQHWYAPAAYATYSLYWVLVKDFSVYFGPGFSKHQPRHHLSFWLQKLGYAAYLLVLPLLFAPAGWTVVLTGFLAMHLVQSVFLLFTFFITHHTEQTAYFAADEQGLIPASWLGNQLRSSNDFYPFSKLANFVFGGFNNHIAHHLFPHLHHVHYPKLNRILYRLLLHQGIRPNVTSYAGGVRSHLRHLRSMGRVAG